MDIISTKELDSLDNPSLVARMDEILSSPYWSRMGNKILKLDVVSIFQTKSMQNYPEEFQRKLIYKAFGFLLQLQYTELSISAEFFRLPEKDGDSAKLIYSANRNQWISVSSRMAFEYFIHLTYMLGTGNQFKTKKSAFKRYIAWLKEPKNQYSYFAISAARACSYDRERRTPEVHAATKLARHILLGTASNIDNDNLHLFSILKNQWQFILDIADEREPNGWAAVGKSAGDNEWYELWQSGSSEAISSEIDRMYSDAETV